MNNAKFVKNERGEGSYKAFEDERDAHSAERGMEESGTAEQAKLTQMK